MATADVLGAPGDLDARLEPFLAATGRKTRRTRAPLYPRGLLGPGERKSLQPVAARLGPSGHGQPQHSIASPARDDGPLRRVLAEKADGLLGGLDAALVIDDTALPKKGALPVGVARQCCGRLGKKANCQALVSLTLARGGVPVPVALRLFLPDEWTGKPERCARAGAPEVAMAARGKGEIALAELDRLRAAGARWGIVLAGAGHGASAEFRRGPDGRKLRRAVGIPRSQELCGVDVRPVPPAGRRARRLVPDEEPRPAEEVPAELPWRRVVWRRGTKGALAARFAAVRVRVGDGSAQGDNRHLPGEEARLAGEWRPSGERKCRLSNLPADTPLRELAAAIKARRVCEQAHQQLKQEPGLGHFEGRSWTGLRRHALMACIAFAYPQHLRPAERRSTGPGENAAPRSGAAAIAEPACGAPRRHRPAVRAPRRAAPMSAPQAAVPAAF